MNAIRNIAILAMTVLLSACADTLKKDPAALHGDFSGKDASGSFAVIFVPGDIPGVPASKGKKARWSQTEVEQVLYLDANCQSQLFGQLPDWAQAIVKEGGWSALATAVGEGAFAAAFPGVEIARYILGGLGFGAFIGANTGRYRQETSLKSAVGYCMVMQVYETKRRYPGTLEGVSVIPWYGNGQSELPKATHDRNAPALPTVRGDAAPPPFVQ